VAAALAVFGLALFDRGHSGLGRLGVATVVASPSLYAHGFTVALPALLELRALTFWTAIALTSVSGGLTWFGALAIVVAAWFLPALRRSRGDLHGSAEKLHPLAGQPGPWPVAREEPDQGYV
jgi:hypothetical protein